VYMAGTLTEIHVVNDSYRVVVVDVVARSYTHGAVCDIIIIVLLL